jgi:thiosulfate dehydrogenase [quinone] large subunit
MTTLHRNRTHAQGEAPAEVGGNGARWAIGGFRILIGWTFLWAFFDKLLALGYSTGRNPTTDKVDRFGPDAWIHGGNPTLGFLKFGADGPFKGFYHSIAGDTWTNYAFMLGLLAIGISLTFGIFNRLGTVGGVAMYLLLWTVVLPPANNPLTDEHVIGAVAVLVLGLIGAGRYVGVGSWWAKQPIVQRYPILK